MPAHRSDQVVLAVDDELLVLEIIESTLTDGGYVVRTAVSGVEAMAAVEGDRARDLLALVTDVNLGRPPNGWAVARRARELNPGLFVLYVSGDSAHEMTLHGVPGGVMLDKPFIPDQLLRAMASFAPKATAETED
jgi:CheY-like chemotaxis protein